VRGAAAAEDHVEKKVKRASEQDRPDVAQRRAEWRLWSLGVDPRRLIFIDETWATTNMTRLYGRAMSGRRVVGDVPHGHWKTTTLIAALDLAGVRCAMTLDAAVDGAAFESFVARVLGPKLKRGEIVVMDNLSSHKVAGVKELIEGRGAEVLYLPPYSPDLNPIEMAFSKIKHTLRSLEYRDQKTLWDKMQPVLDRISASDAQGFFSHCSYTLGLK
jgi:transposase